MKFRAITILLVICVMVSMWDSVSLFAEQSNITEIKISIDRDTRYRFAKGKNAGELILKISSPPKDLIKQLQSQFNKNFVAIKVTEELLDATELSMIIIPVDFEFSHSRSLKPQSIKLKLFQAGLKTDNLNMPKAPPLPIWEMLADGTVVLPSVNYKDIKGKGPAYRDLMNVVRFNSMGAYEAALKRLKENLKTTSKDYWAENLMLLGEVLFNISATDTTYLGETLRALVTAKDEVQKDSWKERIRLLIAYTTLRLNSPKEARNAFIDGARRETDAQIYFKLGELQVALDMSDVEKAEEILSDINKFDDVPDNAQIKICNTKAVLKAYKGLVREANSAFDECLVKYTEIGNLEVGQLLALAEIRLLSHRYGEAKQALLQVIRDFPDSPKVTLASMRMGDIYKYEQRWDDSIRTYQDTFQRWPKTPYGLLAQIRAKELTMYRTGRFSLKKLYESFDVMYEQAPVGRETKLNLLWNYDAMGRYDQAYTYLVELVRRYNGLRYWPFAPERFGKIVKNAYSELINQGDYYGVISMYTANIEFPLDLAQKDEISTLVADAYSTIGHLKEASELFLRALDRRKESGPGEKSILLRLAEIYLAMDDVYRMEKTMDYYKTRYSAPQDLSRYYALLGQLEESRGKMDKSEAAYETAAGLAEDPGFKRSMEMKIGRAAYFGKKYPKASEILTKALSYMMDENVIMDPKAIHANVRHSLHFLADSFYKQRKYAEALKAYEYIAKQFPKDRLTFIARYYRANCNFKLGNYEKAKEQFDILGKSKKDFWSGIGQFKAQNIEWQKKNKLISKK